MSRNRSHRLLTADGHTYLWRVRHRHHEGCDEILTIRRLASLSGKALHFRPQPGFGIPDGGTSAAGVIADDAGRRLNLNEPGVVRVFIDALTADQWPITDRRFLHLDGWPWLDAAHRQRP
ncbi:hypothetical protein KDK95_33270 [Actinospica sp. MGRD01-02]|uniref:Uncharacterized protein n=1 Tax=Actinospica acidithermotolerans TaxID=2828514 RepID=A0A941IJX0_9ACTN|nr:hypothetical protein [Actinospica acidithermotolerans]MBR7831225.1 hypothetical protein [Actinospica acidithermotolerans]